jgi:calcineurin-binding protein cabin-1
MMTYLLTSFTDEMLKKCLRALETCALRFPQHYKSVYRLAYFYFRSKQYRDLNKCKELLLGQYKAADGQISGLFSERKNNNFFNGIWRIPAGDVDRAGSFAAHMSRSVTLLMEVLRDLKDHKMLLELCLQLRKLPEPDK